MGRDGTYRWNHWVWVLSGRSGQFPGERHRRRNGHIPSWLLSWPRQGESQVVKRVLPCSNMIGKASFHCGSHAQRLMDAAEIVIGVIDRNHVAVILELLGERVRESR